MTRILLISHDVVGQNMAGPGIRYYHLARILANYVDTTLAIPNESPAQLPACDFAVVRYTRGQWATIAAQVQASDVCLFPSDIAGDFPALGESQACLVVDGYDPLLVEWLALHVDRQPVQQPKWQQRMIHLNRQYLIGDFYICASERQRDWWLGLLEANGRINPATFSADPSLRNLIDLVPFGLAESTPQHTKAMIKGVWPGIRTQDKVLLWGGGLWPWLDPLTAIQAMAIIGQQRPDIKLIFPGTRHPNPIMKQMTTHTEAAKQLAAQLGLADKAVFFGDWVDYADWDNVLLESDVALTLHFDTLETRLAFRSRVLDYIRAGLPIVATTGDATSELIKQYGLGTVVDAENAEQVAQAVLQLLAAPTPALADKFAVARQALRWEQAAQPLIRFCQQPWRAADRPHGVRLAGSPYYVDQQEQITNLKALITNYEKGHFIRMMRWLHKWRGLK